jgi:hypothetical protein
VIAVHIVAAVGASTVETVGAYAGLAAVVGLGVLSLLYFSQAREVRRLREWAGRGPERAVELEQRVQVDAQRRVVAQPLAPATIAAQNDVARQAAAAAELYAKLPAPPPAPAPLVGPPGQLARPGTPAAGSTTTGLQGVSDAPLTPAPGPATPAAGATHGTPAAGATPGTPAAGAAPSGVPDAGGSAASTATAAATAAARRAAMASRPIPPPPTTNGAGQDTHESAAARPSPLPPLPKAPTADSDDGGGFSVARIAAIVSGAVVVVLLGVFLMITLTEDPPTPKPNDFGTSTQAASPVQTSPATSTIPSASGSSARVDRGSIKIAVLNGTRQTGLARGVADRLGESGFTIGTVGNNTVKGVPQTIVSFTAGSERAAQIVANLIKVERSSVQPIARTTSAAADVDVVVTVGTDLIE